jgi:hypothetical protein
VANRGRGILNLLSQKLSFPPLLAAMYIAAKQLEKKRRKILLANLHSELKPCNGVCWGILDVFEANWILHPPPLIPNSTPYLFSPTACYCAINTVSCHQKRVQLENSGLLAKDNFLTRFLLQTTSSDLNCSGYVTSHGGCLELPVRYITHLSVTAGEKYQNSGSRMQVPKQDIPNTRYKC